jgi:hypothetical protein
LTDSNGGYCELYQTQAISPRGGTFEEKMFVRDPFGNCPFLIPGDIDINQDSRSLDEFWDTAGELKIESWISETF